MARYGRAVILIFGLLWACWQASAARAQTVTHVVQRGETLGTIATRYGVTVSALMQANRLTSDRIYAGQTLAIPGNAPAPSPGDSVHVVQAGETLFRIGLRYNLPWTVIAQANGLADTRVYAGQTLRIPARALAPVTATPAPSPTPAPVESPPAEATPTEAAPPPAESAPATYVVQAGDTLFKIGLRFNLPWTRLAVANNLKNDRIFTGQTLIIPSADASLPAYAPAAPPAPAGTGKRFLVDLSDQRLYAYEGDTLVRSVVISSGLPRTPTVTGTFKIYARYKSADMSGPGYYLKAVPYVMYFYQGYGLHGTYWHNNFGQPMSRGCVNLPTPEAEWAYNWSDYGTPVIVQP